MPGTLEHSPADIVRQLLIDLGYGVAAGSLPWPIFVANEPPTPDNTITVYDTVSRQHGRTSPDNERQEHHGIQIRIRAALYDIGYRKSREIAVALDEDVYSEQVIVNEVEYIVHNIIRMGDVMPFPKPMATGNIQVVKEHRNIFVINAIVSVRQVIDIEGQDSLTSEFFGETEFETGTGTS